MIDHQNWKLVIGVTSIIGLQPWCETDTPNFQPSFYWLVSNQKKLANVNRVDLYNINPNQTFSAKYINSVTLTKKCENNMPWEEPMASQTAVIDLGV